jgi:hypothetical protein
MRTGVTASEGATEMGAEALLTENEALLLARAKKGRVLCPWCDRVLRGEPVFFEPPDDDFYVGVRLYCSCGFVEY